MPTRPPLARGSDERLAQQSGNPGGAGAGGRPRGASPLIINIQHHCQIFLPWFI